MKKRKMLALCLTALALLAAGCGKSVRSKETAEIVSTGVFTLQYTAVVSGVEMEGTLALSGGKMDESVSQGGLTIRTIFDGSNWYVIDGVNNTYAAVAENGDALGLRALGALTYTETKQVTVGEETLSCEVYSATNGEVRFYIRDKAVAYLEITRQTGTGAALTETVQIVSLSGEAPQIALPGGLTEVDEAAQIEAMYATQPEYPEA